MSLNGDAEDMTAYYAGRCAGYTDRCGRGRKGIWGQQLHVVES